MAVSIEERIAAAFLAALTAEPAIAELSQREPVARAREDARSFEESPSINIKSNQVIVKPLAQTVDDKELTLDIEIFVRGENVLTGSWETLADAIAVQVHLRLIQRDYQTADGLKIARVRLTDGDWAAEGADQTPGKRTLRYVVRFLARADDITAQP